MSNVLHYRGDRREALTTAGPMGPGRCGNYCTVEAAEYDETTDTTTAHMVRAGDDQ